MGRLDDLKKNHADKVRILESEKFEWEPSRGCYIFVRKDGTVDEFSYEQLADHDTSWLKNQIAARGYGECGLPDKNPSDSANGINRPQQ